MMYYLEEYEHEFFEEKRFNDNNLPTWQEIEFFKKHSEEIEKLYSKIENKNEKISISLWHKIKKICTYKSNQRIDDLREPAIKKQPFIQKCMELGIIKGFEIFDYKGSTILEKLKEANIESYSNMYEFFQRGEHIGNCGRTSILTGIVFDNPLFHIGNADCLLGTKNYETSSKKHAWIETTIKGKKYIVDTSMMLVIPIELKKELGYYTTKKVYTQNDYINDDAEGIGDLFYGHYKCYSKYTTKDKLSYTQYRENLDKLKIIKKENKENGER